MGLDGVDDFLGFLVLAGHFHADGDVAALDLVVDGLAKVVEQSGALGGGDVHAQLGGDKAGDVGDLDGVAEHVLAVAGAVFHAAEQLDQLGVEPCTLVSNTARSPSALMVALTSFWAFATISSMRAGWMRPS
jgi:hypothetical protein